MSVSLSSPAGKFSLGEIMNRIALIAAVLLAAAQPALAAGKEKAVGGKDKAAACMPVSAAEAQEALRYMTELGIATNACTSRGSSRI